MTAWLVVAGLLVVFALGVLAGHGQLTRQQDERARRQADTQRAINEARYTQQYGARPPWAGRGRDGRGNRG